MATPRRRNFLQCAVVPSSCERIDHQRQRRKKLNAACRLAVLLVTAATLFLQPGCSSLSILRRPRDPLASVPRPRFSTDPQMEEVVDHLNRNVDKLHSWQAHSVKIRANNMPLSGTLAVEEGQHLRLVVHSIAGHEVDMGSNNDVFWIWAKRMDPSYVYCKHTQIDAARQTLGVPFEPQWLMQALGVQPLDTHDLTMQIDPTGQQARLVQPVITAHGRPLQKVMLVDLVHGVIVEHSIYDDLGHKLAQARLEDFRLDKSSGIVLPHRVRLDWPQNQMSLVMNLGTVDINPESIPSQIWDMPKPMPGVQMVDLGRVSSMERIAETQDPTRRRDVSSAAAEDDDSGRAYIGHGDAEPDSEIKFDAIEEVEASEEYVEQTDGSDAIEFQTAPIERPQDSDWWDEE